MIVRIAMAAFLLLSSSLAPAADTAAPPELAKLKETYQTEIARLTEPVTKRYAEALNRLQQTYTKAGQLDKAMVVKGELDLLIQQRNENKTRITDRDLDESRWIWGSGGTLTLHRQNKAMHTAWTTPGVWKRLTDLTVLLTKSDGTKMTIVFVDGELTAGEIIAETGGKTTLTRLPK
jgi:hypothetical protein